jgi:uncharacterized membrane protein YkvA (DUF1232 family)
MNLGGIPETARFEVERLGKHASEDLSRLTHDVDTHVDHLRVLSREIDTLDLVLAMQIAGGLRRLIVWGIAKGSAKQRRAIWVAAQYFLAGHDSIPDTAVPEGFVDDAAVFNAVAFYVGRGDLQLAS